MLKKYLFNILISLDQLVNTILGGDPDETISSRLGKYVRQGRGWIPKTICKALNFLLGPDHCIRSIEEDRGSNAIDKTPGE